ncbi:MAG: hypothetical protein KDC69_11500, partial [Flavobacteriaceae bacterium]|nr:hypothetical protein [Flavobacteriaceae bacterium]
MRGFKQQEPSFKQPSRKLSWQFSSASLHPKAGTGENDRYADGASNLRKKPVQKIGEHYNTHHDFMVNFIDCVIRDKKGKATHFSWVTDLLVTEDNVFALAKVG